MTNNNYETTSAIYMPLTRTRRTGKVCSQTYILRINPLTLAVLILPSVHSKPHGYGIDIALETNISKKYISDVPNPPAISHASIHRMLTVFKKKKLLLHNKGNFLLLCGCVLYRCCSSIVNSQWWRIKKHGWYI